MIVADSPEWLVDIGVIAASVTAVLILLGLLGGRRAVRWVGATLSHEIRDGIGAVIDDKTLPRFDALDGRLDEMDGRLVVVERRTEQLEPNGGTSLVDRVVDTQERVIDAQKAREQDEE